MAEKVFRHKKTGKLPTERDDVVIAKPVRRLVVAIPIYDGAGPCRGRYFLVPPRKYPKRRHRKGA